LLTATPFMGRATMHFFSKIIVLFGSMTVLTILLIYTKKRAVLTNHVLLSMQNPKDHINERTLPDCVTFLNNAQAKAPSANIRGQVVSSVNNYFWSKSQPLLSWYAVNSDERRCLSVYFQASFSIWKTSTMCSVVNITASNTGNLQPTCLTRSF